MVLINGLSRSVCLFHGGFHRGYWFARLHFGGQMVVAMHGLLGNLKTAAFGGLHGYHWFCRYISEPFWLKMVENFVLSFVFLLLPWMYCDKRCDLLSNLFLVIGLTI